MTNLTQDLKQVDFFQDFLEFLRYLEKQPITRTAKGNISRKDIYALSQTLKCIEKQIDEFSEHNWKIVGEWQLRDIDEIKEIAKVMFLTYNRKGKLLLSKNGHGFINLDDSLLQYTQMVIHYFEGLNWDYFHPSQILGNDFSTSFLGLLQRNQHLIWQAFIRNGDEWAEFKQFQEEIIEHFDLEKYIKKNDPIEDRFRGELEYGFLWPLVKLGCIETQEKKIWKKLDLTRIVRFRPTKLGMHVFQEELDNSLYQGILPITDSWHD